jgi:uncharacterized membrane protein
MGGFALAYALVGLFKHWHFDSSAYDLGIFDQVVWHLSRFETPASTITGHQNVFGDHFHPILLLLAPLYWVSSTPATLLVAQAILLAASIAPVYAFVRARLEAGPAVVVAASYGLFWGIQRTAWFDFHELAFAPLLIAVVILAIDRGRWTWLFVAGGLLLLVKEDMALFLTGCGVYLLFMRDWLRGGILVAASLIYLVAILTFVIPALNDHGVWAYGGAFEGILREPWKAPILLVTPPLKMRTLLLWLGPFLFLPLRSPYGFLLLPVALERLGSSVTSHWSAGGHYTAPLSPVLAMAAGDGLARITNGMRSAASQRRALVAILSLMLLACAVAPGHQPVLELFKPRHYRPVPFQDAASQALDKIPSTASVVAQSPIVPHLSQRKAIYMLEDKAPEADFVIAAPERVNQWPLASAADVQRLLDERRARGYQTVFESNGWIVLAAPR